MSMSRFCTARAPVAVPGALDGGTGTLGIADQLPAVPQQHLAGPGQPDLAAGAVQQPRAQVPFQSQDRLRQWRLRHVQALCCPPEVQFLGDREEVPSLPHLHIDTLFHLLRVRIGPSAYQPGAVYRPGRTLPHRPSPGPARTR